MRKNPREVAKILTEHMDLSDTYFTSVEIAGPGFLNFRLGDKWYADVLTAVEEEKGDYGRDNWLGGKKYMVEFVSANPTGPMHMGNARGGVLGDTLAEVLDWSGADVWREFYVNDFGNQIEKVRQEHRGTLHPAHQGRGCDRVPRGRLPRRRHPRARQGLLRYPRRQLSGKSPSRSATPIWRASVWSAISRR